MRKLRPGRTGSPWDVAWRIARVFQVKEMEGHSRQREQQL